MAKKKCPACGSTGTVKILYSMPTHEVFEAAERGELVLGVLYILITIDILVVLRLIN